MNPEILQVDSVYSRLLKKNGLRILLQLVQEGKLRWSDAYPDKLEPVVAGATLTPWIRAGVDTKNLHHCNFDHKILFDYVSMRMPVRFVPSRCQECWKVVARPQTLKELWGIYELQQEMGILAKCGMEERKQVFGIYGAYWYTSSKQEGLQLYCELREKPPLKGIPLVLKRGCSEFEWACGDSATWEVKPGQLELERMIEDMIVMERFEQMEAPEWQVIDVQRRWIEWAWEHGDPTVYEFTGGVPLVPPYRTYHEETYAETVVAPETESLGSA